MSFAEESVMGHQEKLMDPENQIDYLRKHLRGEKTHYSNSTTIIAAARIAIIKAVNAVYTTGIQKGRKKYTSLELEQMNVEVDRLEKLLKRKNKGENIENEIDCPVSEEEVGKRRKELKLAENAEREIDPPLPDEKMEEEEEEDKDLQAEDTRSQIQTLIDLAVTCFTDGMTNKANRFYKRAIKKIKKAKSGDVDVTDLELTAKSLSSFFSE
jgi:hypothetical protein